jgi:stage V sporulation protein B
MTLGASLVSLTKLIDMTMILRRLQSIGYTEVMANQAYGSYKTLALSVYGLIPTLVNSIALPLVPMLSAAIACGDRARQEEMVRASYRLTSLFAIPASLGVAAYARPILNLLFSHEPEAVSVAAPLLSYLGVSVFLSCMITATNSVLHAYQAVKKPVLSMLAGAALKIVSAYFLIGNPDVALTGAPISTFLCNAAVVLLNLYFASKLCRFHDLRGSFAMPLLSATLSVASSYGIYYLLTDHVGESALATGLAIASAMLLYLIFSLLLGVINEEDFRTLPQGEKICAYIHSKKQKNKTEE